MGCKESDMTEQVNWTSMLPQSMHRLYAPWGQESCPIHLGILGPNIKAVNKWILNECVFWMDSWQEKKKIPCRKLHFLFDWFSIFFSKQSSGSIKILGIPCLRSADVDQVPPSSQEDAVCWGWKEMLWIGLCLLIIFQNWKHQAQMGLLVNSTKHLRKKLYQFSTVSFRS